jgi:predicted NAD/FAD-binding protein
VTNRPQWYVIPGGSREYIKKLIVPFRDKILLSQPVRKVIRQQGKVIVETELSREVYDQVIFASHSDQALSMLGDATAEEQRVLGAMEYQDNEVVLHTDTKMLPQSRAAWAAWNYHLGPSVENGQLRDNKLASLTYNMNILQNISSPETFCVTLNQTERISPEKILRRFMYAHPVFTTSSMMAQQARSDINGVNNTWYCGAYWYNGFHEDGVHSALDVVDGISKLAAELATDKLQASRSYTAAWQVEGERYE